MTSVRNIFVIVLIFILSGGSFGAALYRLKRSQNEYILHRCIASVQLTRVRVTTSSPLQTISPDVQKESNTKLNAHDGATTTMGHKKIKVNAKDQNNYTSTILKDTPLKTVDIQPIQKNRPLVFKKKYPLPELQHNITSGVSEMSSNVIVIKPSL